MSILKESEFLGRFFPTDYQRICELNHHHLVSLFRSGSARSAEERRGLLARSIIPGSRLFSSCQLLLKPGNRMFRLCGGFGLIHLVLV